MDFIAAIRYILLGYTGSLALAEIQCKNVFLWNVIYGIRSIALDGSISTGMETAFALSLPHQFNGAPQSLPHALSS